MKSNTNPLHFLALIALFTGGLAGIYALMMQLWGVKPVFLWTDVLIFLLMIMIALFGLYASGKEHLRQPWRHVVRRKLAMSAAVVLVAYAVIGFLDSLHFREPLEKQQGQTEEHYAGDVLSLLDYIVNPIRQADEKSYSAPFATHLFVKETVETAEGQLRDYPRLKHGGGHLSDVQQDFWQDIALGTAKAFGCGLLLMVLILAALALVLSKKQQTGFFDKLLDVLVGNTVIPWREMLLTLWVLVFFGFFIVFLAGNYHILGTDKVGQDVLYLSLKSIRTGLVIGTLTTLIMLPFAVMLGIMAGYFRGLVDDVVQYFYTTLNSIPGVLLIVAAILTLDVFMANYPDSFDTIERADLRLLFLCLILGVTSWTGLCRMLRGETLKLVRMDYVEASVAFGVGHFKIITRHLLPNVMHIVLIMVVLDFSGLVLAEAVLSYVGVGVDPTMNSWGNMINGARLEMAREPIVWWSLVAAFVFMFLLVLAANLFSDAVRDAFDPKLTRASE